MIKHLIEFDGKRIALDRHEIVQLHSALEPYLVGVLETVPDTELPEFVKQYIQDIYTKRKTIKEHKKIKVEKEVETPKQQVRYTDNVVALAPRAKNKANG